MSAVDAVEAEVRELVRRRGLDPIEDRVAVRRLVDEVVADYDERALTSTLPPLADTTRAARTVYDAVAGFDPLQRHFDDPTVEEIWIYERLTVQRNGVESAYVIGLLQAVRCSRHIGALRSLINSYDVRFSVGKYTINADCSTTYGSTYYQ